MTHPHAKRIAVVGGGPAGLMAAEVASDAGLQVDVFDAMPSVGRKFLLAGKGGMNITHSEPLEAFLSRYGSRVEQVSPFLRAFDPAALRAWIAGLGIDTFVGSSGRVFPADMKAAPLLRAWLHRLRSRGVRFHMRHRWLGWHADGTQRFATPDGEHSVTPDATVLALGGASWARLGSDGAWQALLEARGIAVAPLKPSNCGFDIAWSAHFRERFAGQPLKAVAAALDDGGEPAWRRGEAMITAGGIEGGLIYALSSALRERIETHGRATLLLDLVPEKSEQRLRDEVAHPRGSRSLSSHLQSRSGIHGVKAGLLREAASKDDLADPARLAHLLKRLSLAVLSPRPIDEAISSAGGVRFDALDERLMLRALPGVFCAGEMLDWEAPTGGYLLTACFATGRAAARGAVEWASTLPEQITGEPSL